MKKIIFAAAVILLFPALASAKAYFAVKKEMVERADAIVVVNITSTEAVEQKGSHWTYRQKATGLVEQSLKGGLAGPIVVYGMEDFICAQCKFEKGRFLLFLQRDGDLWAGSNWHLGIRAIKDGKVDWFKNDEPGSVHEAQPRPLEEVVEEIQKILASQGTGK